MSEIRKKHGLRKTRLYNTWANMKQRCNNPNNKSYEYYGGRGIIICKEWCDFINFYNWAINNGYADNLSIDRIDVNGNYCPENCRFVDSTTQSNNMRSNIKIKINDEILTLSQVCKKYNLTYFTETKYYHVNGYDKMIQRLNSKIKDNVEGINNGCI